MTGSAAPVTRRRIPWKPTTPAMTLVFLSPLIGEVLNGATRLSFIFAFVPQLMVWGCGALLIREIVQRWRGGWPSIILLGLGLSVLVEVLVLQTSVAPIPWLQMASIPVYDRIWGVNWLWFAFMLGYETVWIVLVPILITELTFNRQRHEGWLRASGLAIATVVFALGCVGLWGLWTQTAIPSPFTSRSTGLRYRHFSWAWWASSCWSSPLTPIADHRQTRGVPHPPHHHRGSSVSLQWRSRSRGGSWSC